MDPESSLPPLCEILDTPCLGESADISTILRPQPPADPLLPSALLFLACLAWTMRRTLGRRFGEDAHRWAAIALLITGIAVAGIQISDSIAYNVAEEVGMAIDLLATYGLPAAIAIGAGGIAGMAIDDRLTPVTVDDRDRHRG
jgi:hypothetical protein